jgi:ABC-type dipeptide/oligopeptide/nickel transport system permease component
MAVFLLQKVLKLIAVLFGVSLLTFSVLHLIPGDPVRVLMGDMGGGAAGDQSEAAYENMRTQLGLDQPLPVQYVRYIGNALQGDLGRSFQTQRTIMSSVADSLPSTLVLTGASMVITVVLGVLLGVLAAVRYHTWWDTGIMVLSLIGLAMPSFWLGMLLLNSSGFRCVDPALALLSFRPSLSGLAARELLLVWLVHPYLKFSRMST